MSLSQSIYTRVTGDATLTTLISTRIFPGVAPQQGTTGGGAYPYIVYNTISTTPTSHLTGDSTGSGGNVEDRSVVQFDVVGDVFATVRSVVDALRARLAGWNATGQGSREIQGAHLEGERDLHEPKDDGSDDLIFRVSLDFSIWNVDTS